MSPSLEEWSAKRPTGSYPTAQLLLRSRLAGSDLRALAAILDGLGAKVIRGPICAPPLGHLFAYLLASDFIVPMQVPAALRADA